MVLVSACGQGPGGKTDYAAALAGTWTSAAITHEAPNPSNLTDLVEITSTATATIGGDDAASFAITVTDVLPPATEPFLVTTVTGTFAATATTITVMVSGTDPKSAETLLDEGSTLEFGYELTGTELKLSGSILVQVGLTQSEGDSLILTKQ